MAAKPTESRIVTCESMTTGHPDKLCDQISDALLDAHLVRDPYTRCGIEAAASGNEIWVFGQVASRDPLSHNEIVQVARRVIREIGYESAEEGINPDTCTVRVTIDPQSGDIAMGVVRDDGVLGASDQGIVYGYATNETPEGLPLPLVLAQRLTRALTKARITGAIPWLRPDGKAQVSVRYVGDTPQEVTAFVVSAQHRAETPIEEVRSTLEALAREALGEWVTPNTKVHINPTGRFVVGGPLADSGLTGRKVIADTYGGVAHHGGGAFSGKDGTKVDRSAAYAARQAALHLVRSKLAARAEIAIAYAIGVDKPVALTVDTFGTGTIPDEQLAELVALKFDLRPAAMIDRLELRTPLFERTARDGHVGHTDLPWEHENEVDPKTEFLKRVAERAGVSQGALGRFPCGHLQRLGKEHLAVGEHFPYGAQGAELLACLVCESTEGSATATKGRQS
jgi:S-adenosylmethionine synthetase